MEPGLFVTVIGASDCSAEETKLAEEVGRELARRGATLICGGLEGVMEAAGRGACSQGGITIGILPGNSRKDANPYVRIPIVTGMGYTRNAIVAKSGQAVIAIGGSYGTLSEIAYALQSDIPVIGLGTWSLARGGVADKSIIVAQNPVDAVEKAIGLIRKG
jgi:hypothetical protein